MPKAAIITGCSSQIGLAAAVALARAGYAVVATARNPDRVELPAGHERAIELRRLDVTDEAAIKACVAGTLDKHGAIDLLLNNAGAGHLGGLEHLTTDQLRRVLEVNFVGVWSMTRAVLPSMRAARSGRILTVTSLGGVIGQPFNDAYCASKFAVEGFMESLAPVVRPFGVAVSLIEPGAVATSFVANQQAAIDARLADTQDPYAPLLTSYVEGTRAVFQNAQQPEDVAEVILQAATAERPHFRYQTHPMVTGVIARKLVDTTGDSVVELSSARLPKGRL